MFEVQGHQFIRLDPALPSIEFFEVAIVFGALLGRKVLPAIEVFALPSLVDHLGQAAGIEPNLMRRVVRASTVANAGRDKRVMWS